MSYLVFAQTKFAIECFHSHYLKILNLVKRHSRFLRLGWLLSIGFILVMMVVMLFFWLWEYPVVYCYKSLEDHLVSILEEFDKLRNLVSSLLFLDNLAV